MALHETSLDLGLSDLENGYDEGPAPAPPPARAASGDSLPGSAARSPYYEERRSELNTLFGMKKWKGHISRRPLAERSAVVRALYEGSGADIQQPGLRSLVTPGNIVYAVAFGWWLALLYALLAALLYVSFIGQAYARLCWELAGYHLWPFGKHVLRTLGPAPNAASSSPPPPPPPAADANGGSEQLPLLSRSQSETDVRASYVQQTCTGTRSPAAFAVWMLFLPVLWLAHGVCLFFCFFFVILMPMTKVCQL